jgi:hypothetical protein
MYVRIYIGRLLRTYQTRIEKIISAKFSTYVHKKEKKEKKRQFLKESFLLIQEWNQRKTMYVHN